MKYDVIVIGGGPGGYVAAIRAAQLGMKTALVESTHLGGICLNWGCIPTKALLRSAELYHTMQHAESFGIKVKDVSFDFQKIVKRSRDVAEKLSSGISHLMKKNKVEVIKAHGKIVSRGKVSLDGKSEIEGKHIIISTGARARALPGIEADGNLILTYKEAMNLDKMPKSILVIGSGAIGIEFASFYRMLGADVTVVEMLKNILPAEDLEISKLALKSFEAQGIKIKTSTTVKSIKKNKNNVDVKLSSDGVESNITVEKIIVAAGVVANTENLGLETTKVKIEKGSIKTDQWCKTDEDGIYAIGDVTSPPLLAHKASHEAVVCVEKIAGLPHVHPIKKENIPGCTYCVPQIASVGLTEEKAKEKNLKVKIGRFPYMANGKAIAMGETSGLIKTIFDEKTGELLGAHLIGPEVTELISTFLIGKTMEATEEDFMHTIFPHPTLSEMIHESVLDAFGKVLHI